MHISNVRKPFRSINVIGAPFAFGIAFNGSDKSEYITSGVCCWLLLLGDITTSTVCRGDDQSSYEYEYD